MSFFFASGQKSFKKRLPLKSPFDRAHTTLLGRVLRRFFKGSAFLEGFLEGAL